jgi:hypothetical protein
MNVISIPRFSPLGDMALSFDGNATIAQATLRDALNWGGGFSLTFWINVPLPDESSSPRYPQCLIEIYAPGNGPDDGLVAQWSIDSDFQLGCKLLTGPLAETATPPVAELREYLGQWVFIATVYDPPAGDQNGQHGRLCVAVTDGSPVQNIPCADLATIPAAGAPGQILTLGSASGLAATDNAPFRGMITRMRLWQSALALDPQSLAAQMYDYPTGWKAYRDGSMVCDWRMSEGYGEVAFDYANAGGDRLPRRYEPPQGNHLNLGTGVPGTEPAWVVADLVTLVHNTAALPMPLVTARGR